MGKHVIATIVFGASAALGACSGAGDESVTATEPGEVHRTVVELRPEGNVVLFDGTISTAQQKWEIEDRARRLTDPGDRRDSDVLGTARQSITHDYDCAGSSLWIFSDTYMTGFDICFYGQGVADLSSYCRVHLGLTCIDWWDGAVRSYDAGQDYGFFGDYEYCRGGACTGFAANAQQNVATSCEQAATELHLGLICSPTK